MYVTPEIASILTQKDPVDIAPHHEHNASHDAMFFNDIKKLQARINECCNPFKDLRWIFLQARITDNAC